MKNALLITALMVGSGVSALALAQATPADKPAASTANKADAQRLMSIAQANIAEIAAGKMALEKSTNADVKTFAQTMIDDHTKGLEETKKVAAMKNVTLPDEPDAAHKKMAADMSKLSGAAFDKAYISKAGVADHTKVLAKVKADGAKTQDADVKALTAQLDPTVAHHLDMAKKLNSTIK